MQNVKLSINPTYFCNFRCKFCYLTPEQLGNQSRALISGIEERLLELKFHDYTIDHVDLYGGEVALLGADYLYELDKVLQLYDNPTVNVITNLSSINPYFLEDHVDLAVSFDFEAREKHEHVLKNIMRTEKDVSILMLASDDLLCMDVDEMINIFNHIGNIRSVEIKPYSTNQANRLNIKFSDYETFLKKWLTSKVVKKFHFTNKEQINQSLARDRMAFSADHIYITPTARFAVLEFDDEDREFFLELENVTAYEKWRDVERGRVYKNKFCSQCEFLGNCLTEHYRNVTSLDHSCNGFKHLLEWHRDQRP